MKAEEIRARRKAVGWTQEKLASLVGVTRKTINGVEGGNENASETLLIAIDLVLAREEGQGTGLKEREHKHMEHWRQIASWARDPIEQLVERLAGITEESSGGGAS